MQSLIQLSKIAGRSSNTLLRAKAPLVQMTRRFDGGYPWFQSMAENIPRKNPRIADDTLDETEVITRIMHVLLQPRRIQIYEFHTIFEDRVFENFENLDQVK